MRRSLQLKLTLLFLALALLPVLLLGGFVLVGSRTLPAAMGPEEAATLPGSETGLFVLPSRLFQFFGLLLLGGVGVTVGLSVLLGRAISRPMQALAQGAAQLREGHFDYRLELKTGDEIEQLAAEFNRLAAQLEQSYALLEERVQERTEALSQANERLADLQAFTEAIVQAIPSSILVFNRNLELEYANETFFKVWHRSREDLGKRLTTWLPPQVVDEEGWATMIWQVIDTGEPIVEQHKSHASPTRGLTHVRVSVLPHTHAGGETRALVVLHDITQRYELEQQLLQSEKLAGLGQLSAGIAHELRNPLNAINIAAYCVAEGLRDPEPERAELEEQLKLIQRNVARAERIITDILQFARPSGAAPMPVDINELIETTLSLLDKSFVARGLVVEKELNGGPKAFCSPDTAKQVLLNVIVNALQAMPDGGTLGLRTFYDAQREMVCAEISDTGPGIPPEHLSSIFNPFFTTKEPGQGTGLGLSIARSAVEKAGGQITVESDWGRGTTLRVQLPAVSSARRASGHVEQSPDSVSG